MWRKCTPPPLPYRVLALLWHVSWFEESNSSKNKLEYFCPGSNKCQCAEVTARRAQGVRRHRGNNNSKPHMSAIAEVNSPESEPCVRVMEITAQQLPCFPHSAHRFLCSLLEECGNKAALRFVRSAGQRKVEVS
ncbi:unnamed protein product [Pleuronectes platessa]|uniref:Uncharacterized protein n=1 Tax=Pleuronectes platessa TaxID=8262 RepID=A0A9N7VU13_PLEPL|nr:unnamed protein product [Pleuronectes platessa]